MLVTYVNSQILNKQGPERQEVLSAIHEMIIIGDTAAKPEVSKNDGKRNDPLKTSGVFKYGLASVKEYMSLHVMPNVWLSQDPF